ncbi:MAG: DUF2934 domain-containing protein [Chthoniobacterales bacterium]
MPSKNQDMDIPSPQFAREQDKEPSIDITDMLEDKIPVPKSDLTVTDKEIAALAMEIYQEEGCPEGRSNEHWHLAEQRCVPEIVSIGLDSHCHPSRNKQRL